MSLLFGQVAAFAAGSTTDKTKFPITPATGDYKVYWNSCEVTKNTTVVLPSVAHDEYKDISVQIKGKITVKSGCTLTIKMDTNSEWTRRAILIVASDFSGDCMFFVEEGASLVLEGVNNSNKYLGMKGTNVSSNLPTIYSDGVWTKPDLTVPSQNYHFSEGYGMITTVGNLTMKNVRMYDVYSDSAGGALVVQQNKGNALRTYGKVSLTDCNITGCIAEFGPAIVVYNQVHGNTVSDSTVPDPEASSVTLTNCTIKNCYCTGTGACGTIRTGGSAYSNLYLNGVTITGNYAEGYCAGIAWNAHGLTKKETTLTLDGCTIANNYSVGVGAGLHLSASFQFVNNITNISNNVSGTNGGGVYIKSYTGVDGLNNPQTLNMSLNEFASINGNKAQNGAGIYIEAPTTTKLATNSVINVSVDGAVVSNNVASGNGGGIYFYGDTRSIDFNVTLNSGTLSGNTAVDGGGFYGVKGANLDPGRLSLKFNGGEISGCTASGNGGGIYVDGLNIACDENVDTGMILTGNETTSKSGSGYGGGIYIAGGAVFNMNSGLVSDNTAGNEGGGLYITGSSVANIRGGDFYNNKSWSGGGGIFLNSGTLTMSNIGERISRIRENKNGLDGTSNKNGAGVYVKDGTFTMEGGEIINNVSVGYGGGVYLGQSTSRASVTGGNISGNAARYGAGFFIHSGECDIEGGTITQNTADRDGGGIFTYSLVRVSGNATITENEALGKNINDEDEDGRGGGILVGSGGQLYMSGNCVVSNNTSREYGGGLFARNGAQTIQIENGIISGNSSLSGGAISMNGGTLTFSGGQISSNTSVYHGGGIYAMAGNVTIENGEIFGNTAELNGGAINYNVSGGLLTIDGGSIHDNNSQQNGGGIFVAQGTLSVESGSIIGNTSALDGGGVYVNGTGATFTGGQIQDNIANRCGGGLFLNTGSTVITDGNISGNKAVRQGDDEQTGLGGGLYIKGASTSLSMSGGTVGSNVATHGGGMYIPNGIVVISGGNITNNEATSAGGGICYKSSTDMTISNGVISGNIAGGFGAGIAVDVPNYTSSSTSKLVITGGTIQTNHCDSGRGGGISVKAGAVNITGGNISNNIARVGGGVHLGNSDGERFARMVFGNGMIHNNHAVYVEGKNFTTGYNKEQGSLAGVGGGVYVDKYSALTFEQGTQIGLYNNLADKMGDDIFANGNNTSVTLPYVGDMDLSGYQSETSELFWVEDYMANDTGYANGTNVAPSGYKAVRYRDALASQSTVYPITVAAGGQTYANKYLALSLGHEIIFITIIRSGLLKGENAIYRISRQESNDTWTPYSEIIIFGPKDADATNAMSKSSSKTVALYSGTWKVEEIGWAWSYDHSSGAITHTIGSGSSAQEKSFIFMGSKLASGKEGYVSPEYYGESVVTNDFGSGTADTDKGAPASSNSFETITPEGGVSW